MSLSLQNPADPSAPYLLEHILDACQGAKKGGGAFAWATAAGVQLLLEDSTFSEFLSGGPFDLVLGVDAITNARALARLASVVASRPSLSVQMFLHSRPNALFHPKICWFGGSRGGTAITGSGNLTVGGLRGNWEAFATEKLGASQLRALEAQWQAWKIQNAAVFRSPSDPAVIAEAAKNVGWHSRVRTTDGERGGPEEIEPEAIALPFSVDSPVLIAEIPRAGNRWNQANFDMRTYEGYFGARVGSQRRVILRHVSSTGRLEELESRPSVEVASHNYRFELSAASGLAYPTNGRPTAVFIRQPSGVIVYRLLLPSDAGYISVLSVLDAEWNGPVGRMRRIVTSAERLREFWPDAPFWNMTEPPE